MSIIPACSPGPLSRASASSLTEVGEGKLSCEEGGGALSWGINFGRWKARSSLTGSERGSWRKRSLFYLVKQKGVYGKHDGSQNSWGEGG